MSEIKMLPLPKKAQLVNPYAGRGIPTYGHSDETLTDYARAVAEHNVRFLTHELANAECAIDAEQAGRKKAEAEIEKLRALLIEACDDGDEADADLIATLERARAAEARAERLAEALRRQRDWWLASKGEAVSNAPGGLTRIDPGFIALCDAHVQQIDLALRDHDQEGKDG